MTQAADLTERDEAAGRTVALTGNLSLAHIGDLPQRLNAIDGQVAKRSIFRRSIISTRSGRGSFIASRRSDGAKIVGAGPDAERLIDVVSRNDEPTEEKPPSLPPVKRVLDQLGTAVILTGTTMIGLLGFLGATIVTIGHLIRHPRRMRLNAVVQRFEVVGVTALGIIGLMSFLIGIVIAQQGSVQLAAVRHGSADGEPRRPPHLPRARAC